MPTDFGSGDEYLGDLPDSPPIGVFTLRAAQAAGGGGDYVVPIPKGGDGTYTPPPGPGSYAPGITDGLYSSPPGTVLNVGWEVMVLKGPDFQSALALVTQYQGMDMTRGLNDDGGGSISLNRDAPLFYTEAKVPNNLLVNGNFDTAIGGSYTYGWQPNSRTVAPTYAAVTSWFDTPSRSLGITTLSGVTTKLNTTEGSTGIPVIPNTHITLTAVARPATGSGIRPTRLYVEFYDASGTYLSVGRALRGDYLNTDPTFKTYLRVDGFVPEEAAYASVGVEINAIGSPGEQHRFDNFAFYITPEATPFYDGSDSSDILDKENLWEIYYNGQRVHEFLGTVRSSDLVNSEASRSVTISGPGTIALLKRNVVLPPQWQIRNGKPWLVSPIKELKDDFDPTKEDTQPNTKRWNGGTTTGVEIWYPASPKEAPRLELSSKGYATQRIASGPWNFNSNATLPGDSSGIVNSLYFAAQPYTLPQPVSQSPADFRNIYEVYVNDKNRAFFMIRSTLSNANKLTTAIHAVIYINGVSTTLIQLPYSPTNHKWLRFLYDPGVSQVGSGLGLGTFQWLTSSNGSNWNLLASRSLSGLTAWQGTATSTVDISQATFRFWTQWTGLPLAYYPPDNRPYGTVGNVNNAGVNPTPTLNADGTTTIVASSNFPTDLQIIRATNPANSRIYSINQNGLDDNSIKYDQMGYFYSRFNLAQQTEANRGRLLFQGIVQNWTPGNYRTTSPTSSTITAVGTDSLGNKRKGLTGTYFTIGSQGQQVSAQLVTTTTNAQTGVSTYTYTDPDNNQTQPALLKTTTVTEALPGQTFYDYFVQSCNLGHCDWSMRPGRVLEIYDQDPDLSYPGFTTDYRTATNATTVASGLPKYPSSPLHKEKRVLFHEGYSTTTKQVAKSSESIVNYVIGHDSRGNYIVAQDKDSIAKWGKREAFVDIDYTDVDAVKLETAVSVILAIGVNEVESWTITVPVLDATYSVTKTVGGATINGRIVGGTTTILFPGTYSLQEAQAIAEQQRLNAKVINPNNTDIYTAASNQDGTRPFVDYKEGDWVSVARHTGIKPDAVPVQNTDGSYDPQQYDLFQVRAIALSIDINGVETCDLTLSSLVESRVSQLQKKLTNVSATSQVAVQAIPPISAAAQIAAITLDSLSDVTVPAPKGGDFLRAANNGVWVAMPEERQLFSFELPISPPAGPNYSYTGTTSMSAKVFHDLNTKNVFVHVYRVDTGEELTGKYATTTTSVGGNGSPGDAGYTPPTVVVTDVKRIAAVYVLDEDNIRVTLQPIPTTKLRIVVMTTSDGFLNEGPETGTDANADI